MILGHKSHAELRGCAPSSSVLCCWGVGSSFSIWTLWLVILIRAAVCHWVMGLIRLEPSLGGGGGQNHQNIPLPAWHSCPNRWILGFLGEESSLESVLAAGEAEPQQGTEDPARGFCITHNSRTELLITLMTGVAAVEFQLLWVLFFWFILWVWKPSSRCCPVLCTVCPLALWTEEETASLPLGKGGWPLPSPPQQSCLS